MDYIFYLLRSLYRKRWWILGGTAILTLIIIYYTRGMRGAYDVEATVYTGVVSGYGIDNNGTVDWAMAQNSMDNLINIMRAESTLKRVSLRLFSRILINGRSDKDNEGITSAAYNYTYNHLKNSPHGKELLALVDKSSEQKTFENFRKYERPDKNNYIYGVFYYQHPYCSYGNLKSITINRLGNSDLLKVNYSHGDPSIAYNTISILMEEFVNEYRSLRYGETEKVIDYFRSELKRIGTDLNKSEDELTKYNIEKRIINYSDETKEIAAINKEFELREQEAMIAYNASKAMLEELEKQMDVNSKQLINNVNLIDKLKQASNLTGKVTEMETFPSSEENTIKQLDKYKIKLTDTRKELADISNDYLAAKYGRNGLAKISIVEQWLDQVLNYEKSKVQLDIIQKSRQELSDKYVFFAPIGTTIKQKERSINFAEQNYLSLLKSYNDALMRKKSLEMTSAALKVLNPPAYPINPESANRKKIVMTGCAVSFLILLGLFLLIEFLDRTLRDSIRAHKVIGIPILGAFPAPIKSPSINNICQEKAIQYMSSAILHFFNERKAGDPFIVNLFSTEDGTGKTYLSEKLENYWKKLGLNVRKLTAGVDFNVNSATFALAQNIKELYTPHSEDILIVEYSSFRQCNVPSSLVEDSSLNLVITSAKHGWTVTDKKLLHKLKMQSDKIPFIYLNFAPKYDVETYTGMLPPYSFIRKLFYKWSQFALTEKLNEYFNKSKQLSHTGEEDDE